MNKQMIVGLLNQHLFSRLRVEVESVETTAASGQVNLTELIDDVRERLTELEQGSETLPDSNRWEGDGLLVCWTAHERGPDAGDAPVAFVR